MFGSRRLQFVSGLVLAGVWAWPASRALACGVSGPDGVWSCSLAEHEEEQRPRWNLGAAGAYTSTALRFSAGVRAQQTRQALVLSASYAPVPRFSFQASAGVGLGGELRAPNGEHAFSPGPIAAIAGSYRLLLGKPFLVFSAVFSASSASTHAREQPERRARYTAFDLRLGAAFGTTLFEVLSPYVLARVFGGPVFWRYQGAATTGTDVSHVQLGAGLSWLIAERVDLYVEGVPLGERGLSGGVAAVF